MTIGIDLGDVWSHYCNRHTEEAPTIRKAAREIATGALIDFRRGRIAAADSDILPIYFAFAIAAIVALTVRM